MTSTKTRFCPSPTGLMHLGNLRTALFSYLHAKQAVGQFLLRIEDTDRTRSTDEYFQSVLFDLRWLGLLWDEGPERDQGLGPYLQSQRGDIYNQYYAKLESAGMAYPCFCSEDDLALARKIQLATGQPPRYSGTCRNLSAEEAQKKIAEGSAPTLRFKVINEQPIESVDLVFGPQKFNSQDLGDFIIRRADGTAPFLYCNALDDALMGVTHVLRGEDHLTNTPRQLLLLRALKLREPQYGHLPLIVGADGSPLAKRHGSKNLKEMQAAGFLPGAIINYLARLGHHYKEELGYMSNEQLIAGFSLAQLGHSPARYDETQLLHWQHEAVQGLSLVELKQWLVDHGLSATDVAGQFDLFVKVIRNNINFPGDAKDWARQLFLSPQELMQEPQTKQLILQAGKEFWQTAIEYINSHTDPDSDLFDSICSARNLKKGKTVFMPVRLALTGRQQGPELAEVMQLLGQEKIRIRFQHALDLCANG